MFKKSFELKLCSIDDEKGTFSGLGSVFGNIDLGNDVVEKGAFKDSLLKRMPKLLWQHKQEEPIGIFTEAFEDSTGLHVKGKLLIEDIQKAREAHALLKAGALGGLSIGFSIPSGQSEFRKGIRYIKRADLFEVSLVTFPMNTEAKVNSVKNEFKGSSLISVLNDRIERAQTDDNTRSDIIQSMASAAGISPSTVNQILSGDIDLPLIQRLRGFASALNTSLGSLIDAAESDGATFDDEKLSIKELETKLRDAGLSRREAKAVIAEGYKGLARDAQEKNKNNDDDGWLTFVKKLSKQQKN